MVQYTPEIQVAVKFIASCLYGKLPRRRADLFAEELSSSIQHKFQGHWYADQPTKGSAFRCLHFTSKEVDPVFQKASEASGIAFAEISNYIPSELSVWVDPGEVSYQIGERGTVSFLYRRNIVGQAEFGHDIQVNDQTEIMNGGEQKQVYTVADFMATKFGSTKNRGQRARAQMAQMAPTPQVQQHQQNPAAAQQIYQQSQFVRNQMHSMMKQNPAVARQQALLQQQLLIQKLTMQNLQQMNQKAQMNIQNMKPQPKTQQPQFQSRWNEPIQAVQPVQPVQSQVQQEIQLNINSQGGFVPTFIPTSRSESNPSPKSDSSYNSGTWSSSGSGFGSIGKDCWSVEPGCGSKARWSPDNISNPDWSSGDDSGLVSNDDDHLDDEIFQQIAALRIES